MRALANTDIFGTKLRLRSELKLLAANCLISVLYYIALLAMATTANISAAQAVGEYLQSPDDLLKVTAFRKKLEKEKASIDARLKSGVKEQLDATREGLRKLFSTRRNVQSIKDEMQTVDAFCSDPQNTVATFDPISRVSTSQPQCMQ